MAGDTGRSPRDILTDFRSFYFDTALSASPASLLALLALAHPDHVLYGSDWPFAPAAAVTYFNAGLTQHMTRSPLGRSIRVAVEHRNAQPLFPRFASEQPLPAQAHAAQINGSQGPVGQDRLLHHGSVVATSGWRGFARTASSDRAEHPAPTSPDCSQRRPPVLDGGLASSAD